MSPHIGPQRACAPSEYHRCGHLLVCIALWVRVGVSVLGDGWVIKNRVRVMATVKVRISNYG